MMNSEESETKSERILIRVTPTFLNNVNEYMKLTTYKSHSALFRDAVLQKMHSEKKIESELDKVMRVITQNFENFQLQLREMLNTSEVTKPIIEQKTNSARKKARSIMDSLSTNSQIKE